MMCVTVVAVKKTGVLKKVETMLLWTTVFAFVAAVYGYVDFEGVGAGQSAYGSFMLPDEAGGYVIVGVLCFAAAVVITLVCIKWKNKSDRIKDKENEGEP